MNNFQKFVIYCYAALRIFSVCDEQSFKTPYGFQLQLLRVYKLKYRFCPPLKK